MIISSCPKEFCLDLPSSEDDELCPKGSSANDAVVSNGSGRSRAERVYGTVGFVVEVEVAVEVEVEVEAEGTG